MDASLPTRGQLERTLTQQIQAFYRNQLGHRLGSVECQIVDQKIVILIEQAVTQPEQLLASNGKEELVEQLHADLSAVIQPQLKILIETVVGVPVIDMLSDTTLETERTGIIAILSDNPRMRTSLSSTSTARSNVASIRV